jgi:hypothetical protein
MQDPGNIARTIWQDKHGSKSVYINLSSSYFTYVTHAARTYYTMMIHDSYLSSMLPIEGAKRNSNRIKEYADIGVVAADFIRRINNDPAEIKKYKAVLGIPEDKRLISFFDDNGDTYDILPLETNISFMENVLKLLDSDSSLFLIFRPRQEEIFQRSGKMLEIYGKLQKHARCLIAPNPVFPYSPYEIMGISDLVITVFSSSILTEALSAGLKTICFAPGRDVYPDFWNRMGKIPGIYVKSYEELRDLANYLLKDKTGENAKRQESYVKDCIDRYCDGKAISRISDYLKRKGELI